MTLTPIEIILKTAICLTKDIICPENFTFVSNVRLKFLFQTCIAKSHGFGNAAKQMY